MCVILVALNQNTQYPFVLAANRDEFYARPTSPADFWNDYPEILAGRDLEANGTWLGVSKSGQFAAITNHHDPFSRDASLCSRGELVSGFLRNQQTLEQYSDILKEGQENYNGYSILFGDRSHLRYQTNKGAMQTDIVSGVHGLSNEFLNSPWSRVEEGKKDSRTPCRSIRTSIRKFFLKFSPTTVNSASLNQKLTQRAPTRRNYRFSYDYGTTAPEVRLLYSWMKAAMLRLRNERIPLLRSITLDSVDSHFRQIALVADAA